MVSHLIYRQDLNIFGNVGNDVLVKLIERLDGHLPQRSLHEIFNNFVIFLHFWSLVNGGTDSEVEPWNLAFLKVRLYDLFNAVNPVVS